MDYGDGMARDLDGIDSAIMADGAYDEAARIACGWYVDVYDDRAAFLYSETCGEPTSFDTYAEHKRHGGRHYR